VKLNAVCELLCLWHYHRITGVYRYASGYNSIGSWDTLYSITPARLNDPINYAARYLKKPRLEKAVIAAQVRLFGNQAISPEEIPRLCAPTSR